MKSQSQKPVNGSSPGREGQGTFADPISNTSVASSAQTLDSLHRQRFLQDRIIRNLELAVLDMGLLGYGAEKEDLEMILHRVREEWDR